MQIRLAGKCTFDRSWRADLQRFQQPLMDVVEAAVGHDKDDISGLGLAHDERNDTVGILEKMGVPTPFLDVFDHAHGGKTLIFRNFFEQRRLPDTNQVGRIEAGGIDRLKNVSPTGVGSRFEKGHQPPGAIKRFNGL